MILFESTQQKQKNTKQQYKLPEQKQSFYRRHGYLKTHGFSWPYSLDASLYDSNR